MSDRLRVLIVGCEPLISGELAELLRGCGMACAATASVHGAMTMLGTQEVALVFCAAELADGSYRDLVRGLKLGKRRAPVVVVSRLGEWKEYLEAIGLGAFDCIAPPYRRSEIERILDTVVEDQQRRGIAVGAEAR
jgi:DNA-binding NtrC family response regulator